MIIRNFGKLEDEQSTGLYILKNNKGMSAVVTNYGASLVSLNVPDRNGTMVDVVLGYDNVTGYERGDAFLGGTIGRVANRIGKGRFTLNGREYRLTVNDGENTLHGGRDPYSLRLWDVKMPISSSILDDTMDGKITFCLESPDGDQGFPGNLHLEVSYILSNEGSLIIEYKAISDADTPIGFTNHSYFNLNGHDSGSILGHVAQIKANQYTATDSGMLPTGALVNVEDTPMDFRKPKMLGADIHADYGALKFGKGYDHNYVVGGTGNGEGFKEIARLFSHDTGIIMKVLTDMPGVQFYTANNLHDQAGKGGTVYGPHSGVCFETQFWPDTVNKESFPGGILRSGEIFISKTEYRFSC